jgi:hypothetical protein
MGNKLILRLKDGSMLRCSSRIPFSAAFESVTVIDERGEVHKIPISEIKAIFFVKDFNGNPNYKAGKEFGEGSPKAGKTISVKFHDGETIKGKVINLAEGQNGFFLYPADPLDNNEKVFVVRSNAVEIKAEEE